MSALGRRTIKESPLTEKIKDDNKSGLFYIVIFLLKRLLISILLVVFSESPVFQLQTFIVANLMNIIYIFSFNPFDNIKIAIVEAMNEFFMITVAFQLY